MGKTPTSAYRLEPFYTDLIAALATALGISRAEVVRKAVRNMGLTAGIIERKYLEPPPCGFPPSQSGVK